MLKYTLEQLIVGIYGTFLLFCLFFVPFFYICGYLFESKRLIIGRIYKAYKIAVLIFALGFILWMAIR